MSEIMENLTVRLNTDQLDTVVFLANDHAATEQALLQLRRFVEDGTELIAPDGGFFLDHRLNKTLNDVITEIKLMKGDK